MNNDKSSRPTLRLLRPVAPGPVPKWNESDLNVLPTMIEPEPVVNPLETRVKELEDAVRFLMIVLRSKG